MASSIVGNLIVRLAADTGTYEAGMRRADRVSRRRLKKIEQRVERFKRGFGRAMKGAGATSGIAAAGLGVLIERQSEAVQRTHALAQAVGMSTGNLQAFGYAFQRVGGDADKAQDIIKDLQDKLGDASANQGGELYEVLDNIGISAEHLQALDPTQQLVTIGNAISAMPQAEQVNVLESIADDGAKLLPLLKDNGKELRRLMGEAREFGVALDQSSVRAMLRAANITQQFKGQMEGLTNQITIGAAPAIKQLGKTLSDPDVQKGLTTLVQGFAKLVEWAARAGASVANAIDAIGGRLRRATGNYNSLVDKSQAKLEDLKSQYGALLERDSRAPGLVSDEQINGLKDQIAQQKRIVEDYKKQQKYFSKLYSDQGEQPETQLAPINVTATPIVSPPDPIETGGPEPTIVDVPKRTPIRTQNDKDREALARIQQDVLTREERINQAYQKNVAVVQRAATSEQQRENLLARLRSQHAASLERVSGKYDQMSGFARQAAANIQNELGNTLEQTLNGNFDGILQSWTKTLQKMAAQAMATQLGDALLGNKFGDTGEVGGLIGKGIAAFAGSFGGPSASSIGTSFADAGISAFGGGSSPTFGGAYANGGNPPVGKMSLVGERGPELFVPDRTGTIIPNRTSRGLMAAGRGNDNNNVEVNVYADDKNTNVDQRREGGKDIYDVFIGKFGKDVKNGGKAAKILDAKYKRK